jgi:MFS family permease
VGSVLHVPQRSVLVSFGLLTACLAAGYGVLFTMLDDYRDTYGIGEGSLGLIIGIGFFAGFLAQMLIAPYADRGHARRLVLGGMFTSVAGLLLMAFSTAFIPLLMGRVVMGVGAGMAMPAIRRIVILSAPDRLGHNLGRLLSIDVAGFAAGPVVSAVLVGPFGIPAPFVAISVVTIGILPFIWRTRVEETVVGTGPSQRLAFDLLRIRPFAGAVALGCAGWLMIGSFDALWAVSLSDLEASRWMANLGITLFALPLVVFGALGGRLAQRVGPFRISTLGLFGGAVCMLLYGQVPAAIGMFVIAMFHSVNDGFTMASTGIAVGLVVPIARQAGAQGVLGGMQVLAAGVGAIVVGTLYEQMGRTAAYTAAAAMMVVLVVLGRLLIGSAFSLRGQPHVHGAGAASTAGTVGSGGLVPGTAPVAGD